MFDGHPMNQSKWANFLESLATSGGNLFLLTVLFILLLIAGLFMMQKWGPGAPTVITIVGLIGTFAGALVGILRGSRVDTPPNTTVDQTIVTKTVPPTEAPK